MDTLSEDSRSENTDFDSKSSIQLDDKIKLEDKQQQGNCYW